jgi:hypothetical protein
MWVPKTTDELENAVGSGDLAETPTLDFKEKLPPKSRISTSRSTLMR